MRLDNKGVELIAQFEGLSLVPYYATQEEKIKGIVTIGYGNTYYENRQKVKITDSAISKTRAIEILTFVANDFGSKIELLIKSKVTQNQFNALVSLAYNIGVTAFSNSTVLRLVNINPNDGNIAKAFLMWNKQSGKELKGLMNRRIKESSAYFTK